MTHLQKLYDKNKTLKSIDVSGLRIDDDGILFFDQIFLYIHEINFDLDLMTSEGLKFIKNQIFYNNIIKNCGLKKEHSDHKYINEDIYSIRFILWRNEYWINIPYQFHYFKDISFFFSMNLRLDIIIDENIGKKRKLF